MRCFFACFGFCGTRKCRMPENNVKYADQVHGSYKPIDSLKLEMDYTDSESEFREENKEDSVKTSNKSASVNLETGTFPSNQRYQKWNESKDDDDLLLDDLLLDDLDDYGSDGNDEQINEKVFFPSDKRCKHGESSEDKIDDSIPLVTSLDQHQNKLGFASKAKRVRSEYVNPVLNPVENLTQWKAITAKIPYWSQQRKENTRLDFEL